MNPTAEAGGLALGMRPTVRCCLIQGQLPSHQPCDAGLSLVFPEALMCHDVGRSAPAVAGLAPVQRKEHRGTATTNAAHRSSPLPVQGVKRCAQQNDYRG